MRAPRSRDDLVVSPRPDGDGVLVYDPATDTGHVLEGTTALVFTACDGSTDVDAIVASLAATGRVVDGSTVDAALVELADAGLLDEARGVSRRMLIGGLVAGAAAIAVAPTVASIVRPRRAAAQPAPTVVPKSATTPQDTAVQITLESTALAAASTVYWAVVQPTHGTVTITNTSSGGVNTGAYATYTPDPGYNGPDSFTYTAGVCYAVPGALPYPAPPAAIAACPANTTTSGTSIVPAAVTITVTPPPTTTSTSTTTTTPSTTSTASSDPATPKYTG